MKGLTFDLQRFAEYIFSYDANAADGNKYILDGTGYDTPSAAFATLVDGDKVKLESDVDITISAYVSISGKTITLDLNGHKWTRTAPTVTVRTSGGKETTFYNADSVFSTSTGGHLSLKTVPKPKRAKLPLPKTSLKTQAPA